MDSSPADVCGSSHGLGSGRGDSLKNPARVKKDNRQCTGQAFKSPLGFVPQGAFVLPRFCAPNHKCKTLTVCAIILVVTRFVKCKFSVVSSKLNF